MTKFQQIVTVVGGTGFLGRYVVRELAQAGYTVQVISRHPDAALHLKPAGDVGQVVLSKGDITRMETIESKLKGSYAVVNLVGVLYERGRQNFSAVHAEGAKNLARAAWKQGAKRFIQISSLAAGKSDAKYARTKLTGEKEVSDAFAGATILRPSVLFGAEDNFFNKFACMATCAPALPLIGGGKTKFQPVYVGDVARAIVNALENPAATGKIYELGGPEVLTFKQILEYILKTTGRARALITLPFCVASLKAAFLQFLPTPPLTPDQVALLKTDNVVDSKASTLSDLGVAPTAIDMVVPGYLARFRKPNQAEEATV